MAQMTICGTWTPTARPTTWTIEARATTWTPDARGTTWTPSVDGIPTDTLVKYGGEVRGYSVDFVDLLATGDSLASVTSVASADGLTLGSGSISGTEVSFSVSSGVSRATYTVTVTVVTTFGGTLTGKGTLEVA